ncbi:PREDICTED: uncharacterized protein LOC104739065 [Camelina sativa]|uniref:Uncharacterized protein LOC104739065 n=1 Tax=Camelina sativa TaxID=90675 RepID=A0ABM0VKK1_CAMSA|nr:PREDICTED: uncharacterized protein LOC104739065 [Camelina sativa]
MFFSLIRQCYRSSSAYRDDGSSSSSSSSTSTYTVIDTHARMTRTNISRRVNRQAPLWLERRRIKRWRPSLSAILEDASTPVVFARETNRSFGKFLARETASYSRRDRTSLTRAWRDTITYRIASPGFAPSPFMY